MSMNVSSGINVAKSGLKKAGNFTFGTWGDGFANNIANGLTSDAKLNVLGKEEGAWKQYKKLGNKETWQNAKANIGLIKENRGNIKLFTNTKQTIGEAYKSSNAAVVAEKEAIKVAQLLEKEAIKNGTKVAEKATAKGLLGKVGGLFKKIPGIGTAITAAFELPNVIKAFSQGGPAEGFKQIGRSAVTLGTTALGFAGGAAAGAIIGQILCPIPGLGFVLGMGASMLLDKITKPVVDATLGKSISEKEEEMAENTKDQQVAYNPQGQGYAPTSSYTASPYNQNNSYNQRPYTNMNYNFSNSGLGTDVASVLNTTNAQTNSILYGQYA